MYTLAKKAERIRRIPSHGVAVYIVLVYAIITLNKMLVKVGRSWS